MIERDDLAGLSDELDCGVNIDYPVLYGAVHIAILRYASCAAGKSPLSNAT